MMMAMHSRPPECAALNREIAPDCEDKLHRTRCAESAVREIPVIETSDRKHPEEVEEHRNRHSRPAPADPDHTDAANVQEREGQAAPPFKLFRPRKNRFGPFGEMIRIEPLPDGHSNPVQDGRFRCGLLGFSIRNSMHAKKGNAPISA